MEIVKAACLFTTHTAVPAGIHIYEEEQLRPYLSYLTRELGINWEQLMQLGKAPSDQGAGFSMFFWLRAWRSR
ncbi:hypothetical protein MKQ70_19935 [Chitinophaga sedimenti]|uniref:hypothetical protein n=1 Tax=Chitinophaga sedimenti TaxID=2033606 RepID=UPI0020040280|nr:hypothetical protein [Chitinophaga sedimenti]MCK7557152.1 hypothetical protein [Chitinophaga sedimenti]